jgi:glutaredoxin
MQDAVEFIREAGSRSEFNLKLYALSTCAFCKRAIEFLKAQDFEFEYIYLDKINIESKREIKSGLKEKYKNLPVFPVLTIKDERAISGFREAEYRAALGLSAPEGA